jgi:hypothetical protein
VNFITLYSETISGAYLANYNNIFWGWLQNNTDKAMLTLRCYDAGGISPVFPNAG